MPPKRRGRGALSQSVATPSRHDDAMDVDTPQTAETPTATTLPKPAESVLKSCWTSEQKAGLFSAVIRWKPSGMHRHFRMIAISEHLRCRGYDPDVYQHTRIPGIWKELSTEYDLETINERDNALDYVDDTGPTSRFKEFCLPLAEFRDDMLDRAVADDHGSTATTPPRWHADSPPPSRDGTATVSGTPGGPAATAAAGSARPNMKKCKRGDVSNLRTRSSTVDSSELAYSAPSPAPAGRGSRRGRRGAPKTMKPVAKRGVEEEDEGDNEDVDSSDDSSGSGENDDDDDDDGQESSSDGSGSGDGEDEESEDDGDDDDDDKEAEEAAAKKKRPPPPRPTRGGGRGRGGRGRGRGRGRGGRGRGRGR